MAVIKIDDGTREYTLVDTYGREFCKLYLRPSDYSIMDRYNTLLEDLESVLAPLADIGVTAEGEAASDDKDDWAKFKAVEAEIIRRLSVVLDTDASVIFEKRNAFSPVGGRFFCEVVLEALGEVIAGAIKEESAKTQARLGKYMPQEQDSDAGAASAGA